MKRKTYLYALPMVLVFSGTALISCIDKDYVVRDVDTSMEIAPGGLKIPLAVLEKQDIKDLLGGDERIVAREGFYVVETKDSASGQISGSVVNVAAEAAEMLELFEPGIYRELPEEIVLFDGNMGKIDFSGILDQIMIVEDESDMMSPEIILTVTNPVPMAVAINVVLDLKDKEGESIHPQPLALTNIPPATSNGPTTTRFFIAARGVNPPNDGQQYVVIHPEGFGELLKTIPHAIDASYEVGVRPGVVHDIQLENNREYEIGIGYDLVFPIRFGSGMNLSVERTIGDVNDVFSSFSNMGGIDIEQISLPVELETTLRLKIEGIRAELLDKQNEPVAGLSLSVTGAFEGPASETAEAHKSLLDMELSGDIESLSKVYGLKLYLPLANTAAQGETIGFRPEDYFQGRAWLSIPAGVDVDLNELLNN